MIQLVMPRDFLSSTAESSMILARTPSVDEAQGCTAASLREREREREQINMISNPPMSPEESNPNSDMHIGKIDTFFRVAHLQSEVGTKDNFGVTKFLRKFPKCLCLYHYTRKITRTKKIFVNLFSDMCNDIPRNRLHRKMIGELIAEELHGTLSHINCTPASVACFGELAGRKSESTCCATQVPKMHMANLEIVWVVWVPGAQKRWKICVYWDVHAWKWNH